MADRNKVIKGLECCTQHGSMCGHDCNGHWGWTDDSHTGMELLGEYRTKCPYGNCETGCVKTLAKDALALLKEQKSVLLKNQHKPGGHFINVNSPWKSKCPRCGKKIEGRQTRFCKYCGQAVKWND